MFGGERNIEEEVLERLQRLVSQLFNKYQLEMIQPRLDYLTNTFRSAFEQHKSYFDGSRKFNFEKTKKKPLLEFKK